MFNLVYVFSSLIQKGSFQVCFFYSFCKYTIIFSKLTKKTKKCTQLFLIMFFYHKKCSMTHTILHLHFKLFERKNFSFQFA